MKKIIFMLGTILFIFTSCSTPINDEDMQGIIEMIEEIENDEKTTTDSTKTEDITESTDNNSTETKSNEVTTSTKSTNNDNHIPIESEESIDSSGKDNADEITNETEYETPASTESEINKDVVDKETIKDSNDTESKNETINEETTDTESENKESSNITVNRLTDKSMYFDDIFEKGESITIKIYVNDKFIKTKTLVYNQKSTMIKFKYGNEYTASLQYNYYIFIDSDLDVTNVTVNDSVINVYLSSDVVDFAYVYYTLDTNYNKNNLKDLICNVELNDGTYINEEATNEYELNGVAHKQYKLFSKVMASTDGIDIKLENNVITVTYATSGVVNYGIISATLENDNLNVVMGKAYSIKTTNK